MGISNRDRPQHTWENLHQQARFRPIYPSEPVVRFVARYPRRSATMLDLGCGAGRHTRLVEEFGHRAVGVDYSLAGLRHAQRLLQAAHRPGRLASCQMQWLPFGNDSFDAAIAYGVLYYADRAGFQLAVNELWRVLRRDGRLLVVARTERDRRFGRGTAVEPNTFVLTTAETSELGMTMHFVSRNEIGEIFGRFDDLSVDWIDHSIGGGSFINSDWVIEATRK